MAQESGPLVGANFTDTQWRAIFGGEPGIVGDVDGTAFNLTLGAGTDDALLGSATQDSVAVVAGFMHRIPEDATQAVTIPPSTDVTGRTDIIAVRYDGATFTTDPGPCRLVRIAGVEGSTALPALDEAPPGVEDLPLWAITRKKDQSLNQAGVRDLRRRQGPNLIVPAGESLPADVPLGARAAREASEFLRAFDSSGTPTWHEVGVFGTRPMVQIGRATAMGGVVPANTSYPIYGGIASGSGSGAASEGASGTYFTTAVGASSHTGAVANPAKITTRASGTYQLKLVVNVQLTVGGVADITLVHPGAAANPRDRAHALAEQDHVVSLVDQVWLPAGAVIRGTWEATQPFQPRSWYLSATRVAA